MILHFCFCHQVVYFTATFPYLGLLTLLIVGALQPGAVNGILYFITPQFDKLLDIQVSRESSIQINIIIIISTSCIAHLYTKTRYSKRWVYTNFQREGEVIAVVNSETQLCSTYKGLQGATAHTAATRNQVSCRLRPELVSLHRHATNTTKQTNQQTNKQPTQTMLLNVAVS